MCPDCISTATMVTAGVSSAGGLGAFVLSKLRRRKGDGPEAIAAPSAVSFEEWVAAVLAIEEGSKHQSNQPIRRRQ
jgi:hypothetical protein